MKVTLLQGFDDGWERCYRLGAIPTAIVQEDNGSIACLGEDTTDNHLDPGPGPVLRINAPQDRREPEPIDLCQDLGIQGSIWRTKEPWSHADDVLHESRGHRQLCEDLQR